MQLIQLKKAKWHSACAKITFTASVDWTCKKKKSICLNELCCRVAHFAQHAPLQSRGECLGPHWILHLVSPSVKLNSSTTLTFSVSSHQLPRPHSSTVSSPCRGGQGTGHSRLPQLWWHRYANNAMICLPPCPHETTRRVMRVLKIKPHLICPVTTPGHVTDFRDVFVSSSCAALTVFHYLLNRRSSDTWPPLKWWLLLWQQLHYRSIFQQAGLVRS